MTKERWNLVHREELLQQLADQLLGFMDGHTKLASLKVTLLCGEEKRVEIYSVPQVLDYLINDVYYNDEYREWGHADKLKVETY